MWKTLNKMNNFLSFLQIYLILNILNYTNENYSISCGFSHNFQEAIICYMVCCGLNSIGGLFSKSHQAVPPKMYVRSAVRWGRSCQLECHPQTETAMTQYHPRNQGNLCRDTRFVVIWLYYEAVKLGTIWISLKLDCRTGLITKSDTLISITSLSEHIYKLHSDDDVISFIWNPYKNVWRKLKLNIPFNRSLGMGRKKSNKNHFNRETTLISIYKSPISNSDQDTRSILCSQNSLQWQHNSTSNRTHKQILFLFELDIHSLSVSSSFPPRADKNHHQHHNNNSPSNSYKRPPSSTTPLSSSPRQVEQFCVQKFSVSSSSFLIMGVVDTDNSSWPLLIKRFDLFHSATLFHYNKHTHQIHPHFVVTEQHHTPTVERTSSSGLYSTRKSFSQRWIQRCWGYFEDFPFSKDETWNILFYITLDRELKSPRTWILWGLFIITVFVITIFE